MDFRLPSAGHFVNVNLEVYEVKLSLRQICAVFAHPDSSDAKLLPDALQSGSRKHEPSPRTNLSDQVGNGC